ncbi:hypothetical protein BOX15_Mlig007712g3 [Macrostomum lignano]|uniref:DNA mismatch repair protein n=1 Tax=Macrostomum lignano TaxID=282301 RepID=A0A267G2M6_9PLAT|nr:hypothetical protein BOX15_Mlig007712g3 [Macrostomum lignano]
MSQKSILQFFSPQNSGQAKKLPWPAASPSAGALSSPSGAAKTPKSLKAPAQSASSAKKQKSISKTPKRKDKTDKQQQVPGRPAEGDLVWARMDPYPWWPALVCRHPTRRRTFEANRRPDRPGRVHVQFLDSPPNRSWVPADCVQLWTDLAGGNCEQARSMMSCGESMEPEDPKLAAAYKMALDAQPLSRSDRLDKLLAQQEPSSGEEDNAGPNGTSIDEDADEAVSTVRKRGREESPDANSGPASKLPARKKRRVAVIESDDDEEPKAESDMDSDYSPGKSGTSSSEESAEEEEDDASEEDSADSSADSGSDLENVSPPSRRRKAAAADKKKQKNPTTLADTSIASTTKTTPARKPGSGLSRLAAFSPASVASSDGEASFSASALDRSTLASAGAADDDDVQLGGGQQQIWDHLKLDWLRPERIRDSAGRRPDNPEYDGRTLLVPERYYTQVTPAMRQWWELKSRHFDTVLFFKVGKFYELYHMDAVLGVQELNLSYMRGAYAHSGFPEVSFGRMADSLVQKGYKVARVEQTETPDQMQERTRGRPGKEKVMRREICRVTTPGTRLASHWDGDALVTKAQYLLAVKEAVQCNAGSADSDSTQQQVSLQFGVAFVDTTIGQVWVGQFADDCHCSRLRTLIAHHPPAQLLHERGRLRPATLAILNGCLRAVPKEALTPGREFWDSGRCLAHLAEAPYFVDNGKFAWPEGLQPLLCESDSLGRTAARQWELGVSALGGLVHYLSRCLIDHDVLSMRNFAVYRPADSGSAADEAGADEAEMKAADAPPFYASQTHAVLDGIALANLDVFAEQQRGGGGSSEATLYSRLDRCGTAFGKRLLQQWLCAPLCHPEAIQRRQEAVAELVSADRQVCQELSAGLKKLPDLEKLTAKMHVFGCRPAGTDHPDQRAVLFEAVQYNKRKIEDFLGLLAGFEAACRLMAGLAERKLFDSELLRQLINPTESGGRFPSLLPTVRGLRGSFDNERAKREGVIIPERGVLGEYDEAVSGLTDCEQRAKAFLAEQGGRLGCKLNFVGSGRTRYQVELAESRASRVPSNWTVSGSRKGFKRFRCPETDELLASVQALEEQKAAALKDVMCRLFHRFDSHYEKWMAAVQCLAVLDVLLSLAEFSRTCDGGEMCRPTIVALQPDTEPFLTIRQGRHPFVSRTFSAGGYIPNDTSLGKPAGSDDPSGAPFVLVTGPNMGGKSTLMRQVALIVVLAQLGCYVPAEECTLTPVDRIFTRLGASDRIMTGESTFLVEMSETSAILRHATRHSLVLLDELGRGTSTYDGTAVAYGVVRELAHTIRCRTLFSTHYHFLVEEFIGDPRVKLGHMACQVERDGEGEEDVGSESITFLYKLRPGACPRSYGFNAARLAGLPADVVRRAVARARQLERQVAVVKLLVHARAGRLAAADLAAFRSG